MKQSGSKFRSMDLDPKVLDKFLVINKYQYTTTQPSCNYYIKTETIKVS